MWDTNKNDKSENTIKKYKELFKVLSLRNIIRINFNYLKELSLIIF